MQLFKSLQHNVFLDALILTGCLCFACFLLWHFEFFLLLVSSDRSYLSIVILMLYALASLHWLRQCHRLGNYQAALRLRLGETTAGSNPLKAAILRSLPNPNDSAAWSLQQIAEHLENRHALGYFMSDLLLKLGLVGTVIGFILMLSPIAEMTTFEPSAIRQLLTTMSSGMAVALFTTLAGLITSTLIKIQYYLADTAVVHVIEALSACERSELIDAAPSA